MSNTPIVDCIKTYAQRCEEHPEHQSGMITHGMCYARMNEECEEVYVVARDLERMCKELAEGLDTQIFLSSVKPVWEAKDALAKWQAMKE